MPSFRDTGGDGGAGQGSYPGGTGLYGKCGIVFQQAAGEICIIN